MLYVFLEDNQFKFKILNLSGWLLFFMMLQQFQFFLLSKLLQKST